MSLLAAGLLAAAAWADPAPARHVVPDAAVCLRYIDRSATNRCEATRSCVARGEADLDRQLAAASTPLERSRLLEQKGHLYAWEEETLHKAVDSFSAALEQRRLAKADDLELLAVLGITQLRLGEVKNCMAGRNADSCLYPLSANARHKDKAGSKAAVKSFTEYLERKPDDLSIRWLLNLAHMTLGGYPKGVPEKWRVAGSPIEKASFPRFRDAAAALGLDAAEQTGSVSVEDYDGDGRPDVLLVSSGFCDPTRLYVNDGQGGFVDRSAESGLAAQLDVGGAIPVDYDNDGNMDVLLTRGSWDSLRIGTEGSSIIPVYHSLMRNLGGGKFEDVTERVGLRGERTSTRVELWGDYDGDGWADLFVCNEERGPDLYFNRKGTFVKAGPESGIEADFKGRCKGGAAGDADGDGRIDLFLSYNGGPNKLYLNKGGGKFERAPRAPLDGFIGSYNAWFFDYDGDGRQDIFAGSFDRDMGAYVRARLGLPSSAQGLKLFRNVGGGGFEDVSRQAGLDAFVPTMGSNFGDLDNDGRPEIYLGAGVVFFGEAAPALMLHGLEDGRFVDVAEAGGFASLQKGHGVAFADLNGDGAQEAVIELGGAFPSDRYFPSLFVNPGTKNAWAGLRLEGVKANRAALGTLVRADFTEKGRKRSVYRAVTPGGAFGSSPLTVHLGLGRAAKIDRLEVRWAASGTVDVFTDVAAGALYDLREGGALRPRPAKAFAFKLKKPRPHVHAAAAP